LKRAALAVALAAAPRLAGAAPLPASVEVVRPDEPIVTSPDSAAPKRGAAQKSARLPVFATSTGPGCGSPWFLVGPEAWICGDGAFPSPLPPAGPAEAAPVAGLPYAYHFVGPDGSFGYRLLDTAEEGVPDAQLQPGFGVAIGRVSAKPGASEPYGFTTHRLWVPLRDLGAALRPPGPLAAELAGGDVAWVNTPRATVFTAPGRPRARAFVEALTRVSVLERVELRQDTWLRIGPDAWLRARDTTSPALRPPPAETRPGERRPERG